MSRDVQIYPRYIQPRIVEALADTPVVLLNGPRQAGKTTLVRQFAGENRKFVSLDDELTLLSARQDPVGLIRSLDCAVIDEVQRAPALLLAIKKSVDADRRPGRFLLTGSANLMSLPTVADSLAGRMETLTMLPLAGCEMQPGAGKWIDAVFGMRMPKTKYPEVGDQLLDRVLRGGYPEAVSRTDPRRRTTWTKQYVDALIQRDVRDIANIDKLDQLPRLLKALAQMSGQLCNFAQLGGQVGLDSKTANKYLAVFESMFLLRRVEPWSINRLNRIVKTPKIQFIDSGLLSTLTGLSGVSALRNRSLFGRVLESYVFSELLKQATWSEGDYALHTYRDKDQVEVDFVIENQEGQIVGVEVKAAANVSVNDLAGVKKLAALAGEKFVSGVVLYDGNATLPIGERLWAVPISTLWSD
jgi:predicted AAA+ superfamily ATPase